MQKALNILYSPFVCVMFICLFFKTVIECKILKEVKKKPISF